MAIERMSIESVTGVLCISAMLAEVGTALPSSLLILRQASVLYLIDVLHCS
jgi:hypothetical protein